MNDTTRDSGLQQAVESLLENRPDLMDPNKLKRFETLLNRYVEAGSSSAQPSIGEEGAIEQTITRPSKFLAFVMNLCGGYFAVMTVYFICPTVPLVLLPVIAAAGFFGTRYLAPKIDEREQRRARERAGTR